jgi:hypothetical protein
MASQYGPSFVKAWQWGSENQHPKWGKQEEVECPSTLRHPLWAKAVTMVAQVQGPGTLSST